MVSSLSVDTIGTTVWVVVMGSDAPWRIDNEPHTRGTRYQGGGTHTHGEPSCRGGDTHRTLHPRRKLGRTGRHWSQTAGEQHGEGPASPAPRRAERSGRRRGICRASSRAPGTAQPAASHGFALIHPGCHWQNRARLPVPSTGQFR